MCKILIAEDDTELRQLYSLILKERGYEIIEAGNGDEALAIYESLNDKPDIVIVDYRMPKRNGLEVTQEILKRNPHSNIMMITGEPGIKNTIIANCGIKFKSKPIGMDEFLSEIRNFAQV